MSDIPGCDLRNRGNEGGDMRQIAQYKSTVDVWTMGCRAMVICGVNPSAIEEPNTTPIRDSHPMQSPAPGVFPSTEQAPAKASGKGLYGLKGHPMMMKMEGYTSSLID